MGFVLFACASAARADPARGDLAWGVNGHPIASYPGISIDAQLALLRDLGVKWYRVDVGSMAQARQLAAVIEAARPYEITILPVVTPGFPLDKLGPDVLYKVSYELAFNLVRRFKGEIGVWELGNEMENYAIIQPCETQDDGVQYNCEWGPAGGVGVNDYYGPRWAKVSAVLRGLGDGARTADPTVRRAMGTAGWGHVGAFERMRRDGVEWDISVWHMYGDDPEWGFKALSQFGKPIWVTEFNSLGGSTKGEEAQSDGLRRTMLRLRELRTKYNVEAAMIYELLDEPYWKPSYEAVMGLVRVIRSRTGGWTVDAPKPAYDLVKSLVAAGDTGETASMTPSLRDGLCDPQILNRPVAGTAGAVTYAYCLALGRKPSADETATSELLLRALREPVAIVLKLLNPPALGALKDADTSSNRDYVADAYEWLLGRKVDGGGLAAYTSDLDHGRLTRLAFLAALMDSGEFKERHKLLFEASAEPGVEPRCEPPQIQAGENAARLKAIYLSCLVLGRAAQDTTVNQIASAVSSGSEIADIVAQLAQSDEKPRPLAGVIDNQQFVSLAYYMILDRAPDGQGLNDYTSALNGGNLTRMNFLRELARSDEFKSKHQCLF